jgi:hypothetical protein
MPRIAKEFHRQSLKSFWGPSIATVFFECFLLLLHTHYILLRAIFRWNIYIGYFLRRYFFYNGSVVLVSVINWIYISFLFRGFFRRCLYVCGGYDSLLFLLHFSILSYYIKMYCIIVYRPPLWSSGQSFWLQIRRPSFDSRHYQKKKSSGSRTGSTEPREYNWGATW